MIKLARSIRKIGSQKLLIIGFFFFLIIFFLTSAGNTPYDYFTRLARAYLSGRLYLTKAPIWLNELVPAGAGKFFVPYPPMPAILCIPFVTLFGQAVPQQMIAQLVGASFLVLTMRVSLRVKKDNLLAIWSGLLVGLGSIVWFMSANGASWYFGQICAALFLTAALLESLGEKRAFLIGLFLGASYLSRIHTALAFPVFVYLLKKPKRIEVFKLALGFLPFFLFDAFYNFVRFGVIWDKGYVLIPGVLQEPWFQKGIFHPSYIPRHIKTMFASFPVFRKNFPYILPSWRGLSVWITTPAFIYALKNSLKERIVPIAWLSVLLVAAPIFMHGTTGFAQFGYRYAVDFYPLLIFLTVKGVAKTGLTKQHWLLLAIGILVNLWGVVWINKFGWVGF